MNVTYDEKSKKLTIVCDCCAPQLSGSGKTLRIFSSMGNKPQEHIKIDGKVLVVGLNAYTGLNG